MFFYFSKLKKQNSDLFGLLIKILLFTTLFIIVTGITGPWIISTPLLYDFHFFIYGNLGKLVIISLIAFALLIRDKLKQLLLIRSKIKNIRNLFYILFAFILVFSFFPLGKLLLTYSDFSSNIPLSLLAHLNLVLIPVFLGLGIFGWDFLKRFYRQFRKEIFICIALSGVLFVSIFQIWKLWPYLSSIVLQVQYLIFSSFLGNVFIIPPMTLFVDKFAVEIGEACSGIESIFLFSVLYIFISVLDWKKLNLQKVVLFYPFLLAGLFIVNIIRVFILIMVGLLISPQIMAALFHTYLGMVLFIVYFLLFLKFIYKRLKK